MLCRVLIVEDNPDLAEAMAVLLGLCGFTTAKAGTGGLALEKARAFRPEVVLMDICLPDMDGYQAAAAIRNAYDSSDSLFIAISAGDPDLRSPYSREARFDYYMIKPVDLNLLVRILSKQAN
ncbi:MAG: response regulator [Isosphaeraceae bacterium]